MCRIVVAYLGETALIKPGMLNHGNVAVYRGGIRITHLKDSVIAERSWHTTQTNMGGILFGTWCHPPGSPHRLDGELERQSKNDWVSCDW